MAPPPTGSGLAEARASFERAVTFLRSGDARMAEQVAHSALADYPGDANFLSVLGAAQLAQGRPADAVTVLQLAVASDPDYAKGYEQLGQALLALDRASDAIEPLQRALDLNPAMESAQMLLGQTLLGLGREAEANQVFEAFVGKSPTRQKLAAAAELHRAGELQKAEEIYRGILLTEPNNISALRLLGRLALTMEHYRDAVVLFQRAVDLAPEFRAAWLELGNAQTQLHELDDALTSMRRAITLDPSQASGYIGLANALARSSQTAEAVKAYEQAVELQPDQAGTYLGLGNVLKTVGRQQDAIAAYRKGIELRPKYAELYWSLSNLKTFVFDTAEIRVMEKALAADTVSDNDAVHWCFALGKACDDAGDYDAAWQYYERGNGLRRQQEYYDPVQTEHIGERIRAVMTRPLFASLEAGGFRDVRPIFIVGLPRTGSTLLEQILSSHPLVEGTHELPEAGRLIRQIDRQRINGKTYPEAVADFKPEDLVELGRRYARETARYRSDAPRFVDKMPNNFALIGLLHLAMPEARFINTLRHPLDTCLSCYKQLFARGQSFTYDLEELADYYLEYQQMMDHWHDVLPGRVLDVQYENVVVDLESEVRRILDYCGLPWDDACLQFFNTDRPVRTASSEQVRQPIYDTAVAYWKRYEDKLESLIEILEPVLNR